MKAAGQTRVNYSDSKESTELTLFVRTSDEEQMSNSRYKDKNQSMYASSWCR